ncbi:MAG: hypothetical protein CME70_03060 [Halobacteriovorax sp.]|nr:hypothetical protein [Halobacteriovorax sp.]|tara:strand:- start:27793 stop:28911 length:1119 start_codon:yes stop_codon:yes gene_type:complete
MNFNHLENYFVYLDTNIFVKNGFNPNTSEFKALKNHIRHGNVRILSNEVLEHEIKTHIGKLVSEQRNALKRKDRFNILNGLDFVSINEDFYKQSHEDITEAHFKKVLSGLEPLFLPLGKVNADEMFHRCKENLAPFGKKKTDEYHDLLQVLSLKQYKEGNRKLVADKKQNIEGFGHVLKNMSPDLIIISNDKKFTECSKDLQVGSHHFESISKFLEFYIKDDFERDLEQEKRYIKNLATKYNHWLMNPEIFDGLVEVDCVHSDAYFVKVQHENFDIVDIDLLEDDREDSLAVYSITVNGDIEVEVGQPEYRIWDSEDRDYSYGPTEYHSLNVPFSCTYSITIFYDTDSKSYTDYHSVIDEIELDTIEIHYDE